MANGVVKMKTVRVSREVYGNLAALAKTHDCSVAEVVKACAELGEFFTEAQRIEIVDEQATGPVVRLVGPPGFKRGFGAL